MDRAKEKLRQYVREYRAQVGRMHSGLGRGMHSGLGCRVHSGLMCAEERVAVWKYQGNKRKEIQEIANDLECLGGGCHC